MTIDLSAQQVTDFHCFSFAKTDLTLTFLSRLVMAGGPTVKSIRADPSSPDLESSIAFRRLIARLGEFLGTDHHTSSVLSARAQASRDFGAYVGRLFDDAKIETIAVDNGLEPVPFEAFRKYASAETRRIFRVEKFLKRLLQGSPTFNEFQDDFDDGIAAAVRKKGFAGFKSVIAYRTGLAIEPPDESRARASLRSAGKDKAWFGPKVKALRDFLLWRTAEIVAREKSFLQIHTGLGDTDIVGESCNPILLQPFLKLPEVLKAPIILIHGGFPYTSEAAWLSSVFPNVHFELSTPFPPTFFPALSEARFADVLEIVPADRVVYGSDAIETPELHWLSARLAKEALGASLSKLVSQRVLGEDDAYRVADAIFWKNAARLLG